MTIEFYKEFGPLGYLANYSNHGFTKNGIFYKTVEHYYQSEKFLSEEIKKQIINAETPKIASNIGRDRNNIRKPDFKAIKNEVMYEGILEKFRQNRDIAYKLIATRNHDIAEATIDEYYWGIGKTKKGENHIGKILVKVREQIKKEILEKIIKKAQESDIVYIIGHPNPDADAIFSSYLLCDIMKFLGVNAKFAILSEACEYNKFDAKLIEDYLPVSPIKIKKQEIKQNAKFILVDHNNIGSLEKTQILGAIDHHQVTEEIYDTITIEYASTGLLIYDLFKNIYSFTSEEINLIALTCLADTEYLESTRYKKEDEELLNTLNHTIDLKVSQQKYFVTNDFTLSIADNLQTRMKN